MGFLPTSSFRRQQRAIVVAHLAAKIKLAVSKSHETGVKLLVRALVENVTKQKYEDNLYEKSVLQGATLTESGGGDSHSVSGVEGLGKGGQSSNRMALATLPMGTLKKLRQELSS